MEKRKGMELDILITIRNNESVESDEFYRLFDTRWPEYSDYLRVLQNRGLFVIVQTILAPGFKKYELTRLGNNRISELVSERAHDIQLKLANVRRTENVESHHKSGVLLNLISFMAQYTGRFRRQAH